MSKDLTAATRVTHCSSNELSTSAPDGVKCKQKEDNKYTLISRTYIESAAGYNVMQSG